MAQQRRMIYGKMFGSHFLNTLPVEARYLYSAMIVLADDDGRLNGNEKYLKGQVFSYDEKISSEMVKGWIEQLAEGGQIVLYNVGNNAYISHPNWKEYQSIRADMYSPSNIPKPLRSRNEPVTESLLKLNQVKLNKDNINNTSPAKADGSFDLFWAAYPRKETKKKALNIWNTKKIGRHINDILAFIEKAKKTERWVKGYVPHATTFLNGERWQDDISSYAGFGQKEAGMKINKF